MSVAVSYPGVYIDEFAPGGPIPAASTNIAAILGPMLKGPVVGRKGPIKYPPKITSFDQFKALFGARPSPGFFAWYAVRGFFENGGTACYVYRITNAEYASTNLTNATATPSTLAKVFPLSPGLIDPPINVTVANREKPLIPEGSKLFAAVATGNTKGSEIEITSVGEPDAETGVGVSAFRINDRVQIGGGGKLYQIRSIGGKKMIVDELIGENTGVEVKLMYDGVGDLRIRTPIEPDPGALAPGLVVRLGDPTTGHADIIDLVRSEQLSKTFRTFRLQIRNGLLTKIDPTTTETPITDLTFDLTVSQGEGTPYKFTNLSSDSASDRYYASVVNKYPNLVVIEPSDPPPFVASPADLVPAFQTFSLAGGTNEELLELVDTHFTDALDDIRRLSDVRLVSVPDGYPREDVKPKITSSVYAHLIAHCEQMADRFGIIDPPPAQGLFGNDNSIEAIRAKVDSARGYVGLYYPWVRVAPVGKGPLVTVPPSGHLAGLMAYVDNTKGVFKAPANEILQGAIGVETTMTNAEHGLLNLQGINVIRVFRDGGRPYVFGARTTATDTNWNYVNIRRLFLFLEKSIQDGIRWAVFEPSNKTLWGKLRQTIASFLATQWKSGALFGDTPKDAYYVRIDDTLNPFEEQRQGRLNIEIGIRPTNPAEFIIVRIGIWQGGSEVSEG